MVNEALMEALSTVVFDVLKEKVAGLEKRALEIKAGHLKDKELLKLHLNGSINNTYSDYKGAGTLKGKDVKTAEAAAKSEVDRV